MHHQRRASACSGLRTSWAIKRSSTIATSIVPQTIDGAAFQNENAAAIASAMQFVRGLRDRTSLITCAGQLVFAGLTAAIAAGDRGGAIGRAAGDFIELHLAGKAVI